MGKEVVACGVCWDLGEVPLPTRGAVPRAAGRELPPAAQCEGVGCDCWHRALDVSRDTRVLDGTTAWKLVSTDSVINEMNCE